MVFPVVFSNSARVSRAMGQSASMISQTAKDLKNRTSIAAKDWINIDIIYLYFIYVDKTYLYLILSYVR